MKKSLFLTCVLLISAFSYGQFTVETHDGDPIVDGDVVAFNTLDENTASLKFYVNNESASPINMKIEFVSATNYNGTGMQLCFGLCYDPISVGVSYPPGNEVVTIQPGQNQGIDGDKFWNYNDGGGNAINYVFRYYQVDGSGNEIGDDLSFTYRYDPDLGVSDNQVDAKIVSTIISDNLTIATNENINVKIYNILGALVAERNLEVGSSNISVSNLQSQVYLVQVTNNRGMTSVYKVVKR